MLLFLKHFTNMAQELHLTRQPKKPFFESEDHSMKKQNTVLKAAIVAACAGFAASASAVDYLINFDQDTAFQFDGDAPLEADAEIGVHNLLDAPGSRVTGYESLWWPADGGDENGRGTESDASPIDTSSLESPTAPTVTVAGDEQDPVSAIKVVGQDGTLEVPDNGDWSDWENLSYTYHRNNPITGDSPVAGAILDSTLFELNGDEQIDANTLPWIFAETTNSAPGNNPDNCLNDAPNGTICDDLFIIPLASFDPVPITLDGVAFLFEFDIVPGEGVETNLQACKDDVLACDFYEVPGVGEVPFFTIWTGEDQLNWLKTTVRARLAPVPAPGALSLMGLGLVGMGLSLRRRRKAAS